MAVEENLIIGVYLFNGDEGQQKNPTSIIGLIPRLKEKTNQLRGGKKNACHR